MMLTNVSVARDPTADGLVQPVRRLVEIHLELYGVLALDPAPPWPARQQREGEDHLAPRQEHHHGATLRLAVLVRRGVD